MSAGPTRTTTPSPIATVLSLQAAAPVAARVGQPNGVAMAFFFLFIATTLAITWWAARHTRTTEHFYAAGRTISPVQHGIALAGERMSAASFLGIAGLVSTTGFDGLIYSTGWLVGWPVVLFLIAEPLRHLGRYTFAAGVPAAPRRAVAHPGALPLRRRGRGAAAPGAGAHRGRGRDARHGDALPDRADGRGG